MNTSLPKLLITGASGQLGTALQAHPLARHFMLIPLSHTFLDITNPQSVHRMLTIYEPDIVINAAAYTAVDKAETEQQKCQLINYHGAKNLAQACQQKQVPLIQLSTDYIFDGKAVKPYKEEDEAHPISIYGLTKLQGEHAVLAYCDKHIILRVSGIFSPYGQNFMNTILRLASERTELGIVADQQTCPTSADDIAGTIFTMCLKPSQWGIFHYCSKPATSWHEFALAIIALAKTERSLTVNNINALKTHEYKTAAKRPAYSVLDCTKIQTLYGIEQPDWHQALRTYIKGH